MKSESLKNLTELESFEIESRSLQYCTVKYYFQQ